MIFYPEKTRKKLRLANYNYKNSGFYYVTLCVQNRLCLFGKISNKKMILNEAGKMLHEALIYIPNRDQNVTVDSFIIMPNHVHSIIVIGSNNNIKFGVPRKQLNTNLSDVIKKVKTYTTFNYINGVKKFNWLPFENKLWQRSFYEHIIRDELNLIRIRKYMENNPKEWVPPTVGDGRRAVPKIIITSL